MTARDTRGRQLYACLEAVVRERDALLAATGGLPTGPDDWKRWRLLTRLRAWLEAALEASGLVRQVAELRRKEADATHPVERKRWAYEAACRADLLLRRVEELRGAEVHALAAAADAERPIEPATVALVEETVRATVDVCRDPSAEGASHG